MTETTNNNPRIGRGRFFLLGSYDKTKPGCDLIGRFPSVKEAQREATDSSCSWWMIIDNVTNRTQVEDGTFEE